MSVTAAIQRMIEAGFTPEQALAAAAICEEEMAAPPAGQQRTARQERNARYYERKASEKRLKASETSYSDERRLNSDGLRSRVVNNLPEEPLENPSPKDPPIGGPKGSSLPEPKPSSKPKSRGTRLSADWQLPATGAEYAASLGVPSQIAIREADKFRDWAISAPGSKGVKLDWDAAWRNWIRRVADDKGFAPVEPTGQSPPRAMPPTPPGKSDAELRAKHLRLMHAADREPKQSRDLHDDGGDVHRAPEGDTGRRTQAMGHQPRRGGMVGLGEIFPGVSRMDAGSDADGGNWLDTLDHSALPVAGMVRRQV